MVVPRGRDKNIILRKILVNPAGGYFVVTSVPVQLIVGIKSAAGRHCRKGCDKEARGIEYGLHAG